jgi:hypothetical protein
VCLWEHKVNKRLLSLGSCRLNEGRESLNGLSPYGTVSAIAEVCSVSFRNREERVNSFWRSRGHLTEALMFERHCGKQGVFQASYGHEHL